MNWLEFIASLVSAVAWPGAVVVIAVVFRRSILPLISTIKKVRYGELQVDFGEEVAAIKEATEGEEDYSQLLVSNETVQLANASPRAAIIDTWIEVEKSALEATKRTGTVVSMLSPTARSPSRAMGAMLDARKITEGTYNMFNNLRVLRNEAAHAGENAITKTEAINTSDMCLRLKARLDDA